MLLSISVTHCSNKSETGDNKTYYTPSVGSGRSRYDSWGGSRDFKDFKRSNSNNWRTQSGNRWRRAQSKFLPRSSQDQDQHLNQEERHQSLDL